MNDKTTVTISGKIDGNRIPSRILEERIQDAVEQGYRNLEVRAFGQHGIGGRLWRAGTDPVHIKVSGPSGQRLGSLGFPNTKIEVTGPTSDDVGWLNAGAHIVIHGHAGNGAANGMAQGKVFVAGNIGARGMTMTKHNPRFDPPELWILGSAGDYFGEFMAGGVAVICGMNPQNPENVLGYRPLVGMVGGKVFFRGPHAGFSQADARMRPIDPLELDWLMSHLEIFLRQINRSHLFSELSRPESWQLLVARTPSEKIGSARLSMSAFRSQSWDRELGKGGLVGDLVDLDRSPIPVVTTGQLRRHVPVWENRKYRSPCEGTCPSGIPVHDRWRLIREGQVDEAVNLALLYTPFPASVCGYLCPNLCMQACTKQSASMPAVDVTRLGRASIAAAIPELPEITGAKIAIIGGGPAGISAAWQLRLQGRQPVVFDMSPSLGGKLESAIPRTRIPENIIAAELERVRQVIPHVHLAQRLTREDMNRIRADHPFIIIAAGAQKPRMLNVPGIERALSALDFLTRARSGEMSPGKSVIIIGAGNVGCDVATEASRLGAETITLIDVQEPASFGKERKDAEAVGAVFRWPCFTREITPKGVMLTTDEEIQADTVVISIGDVPDLDFLPEDVMTERGFITVDETGQTSVPEIFAIGDAVRPGILTDAIGAGRKAATAILDRIAGRTPTRDDRPIIDKMRVSLEYYDPRIVEFRDMESWGDQCASCGSCRDCGICAAVCPEAAISRMALITGGYEYRVDDNRCIGCGFCANACPCGVWNLVANSPLE
jgi:NADPH-dependent glutamate synthase beta subunit-like oxidoreductase/glutamate synthase domain-containing protein 3/Pyruvate/2-oxoacid:ferredoxin oxidoreductase delta subunit